jgi:YD repeat-containing protein
MQVPAGAVAQVYDGEDTVWELDGGATGRLDSVETDGQMVRYEYNAFGQRVEKDGPSGTTGYVWDGSSLIAMTNGSGSVAATFSYLPGIDKPHSMRRNGTAYYYGLDHLGGVWGMFEGSGPRWHKTRPRDGGQVSGHQIQPGPLLREPIPRLTFLGLPWPALAGRGAPTARRRCQTQPALWRRRHPWDASVGRSCTALRGRHHPLLVPREAALCDGARLTPAGGLPTCRGGPIRW